MDGAVFFLSPMSTVSIIATVPIPVDPQTSVIRQLKEGRDVEENFRRLFHQYYPAVYGFFARKGFAPEDCRDLTQEVFVAVYQSIDNLRSETAFVGWLFSIARHVSCRHLDRRSRTLRLVSHADADSESAAVDAVPSGSPDALDRMLDAERVEMMRAALTELPARVQECLRARLVDGLNYREIGDRLGISENTVAVHIHRGLKNLRTRLKRFFGEAPFLGDV